MNKLCSRLLLGLGFVIGTSAAQAAFVDFVEAINEIDPVAVTTNIVLSAPIATSAEHALVTGLHHPGISPSPVAPGKRAAALFEPGSGDTVVSDYVLFTAFDIRPDAVFGLAQDLIIEFFSEDIPLGDLLALLGAGGFTFGGGVVEDGTLQDLSGFLGTLPEGLIIRALSDPTHVDPIPEPATVALLGIALVGLAALRRRVVY